MTLIEFLTQIRKLGLELALEGDALRVNGPAEALSDAVRAELKARKPEIVQLLRNAQQAARGSDSTIRPMDPGVEAPLSFGQEQLWFLMSREPSSSKEGLKASGSAFHSP